MILRIGFCVAVAALASGVPPRPAGPAHLSLPAHRGPIASVPFRYEQNQIIVSVRAGGSGPLNFLLDTGTDPSIVDLATAYRIGASLAPPQGGGAGAGSGDVVARRTTLMSVTVGELPAGNIEAAAIDLSELSRRFGMRIDGVLGYSFLAGRVLTIDYAAQKLIFHTPAGFQPGVVGEVDWVALPFQSPGEGGAAPRVRALEIEGHGPVLASIDTGSDGNVALFDATAKEIGWADRLEGAPLSSAAGYGGSFAVALVRASSVRLGGFELGPMDVRVPLPGANYEEADMESGANVGNGVLSRFRVTLDYSEGRLYLEKRPPAFKGL